MKNKKTSTKNLSVPLAVISRGGEICMLVKINKKTSSSIHLLYSDNGVDFFMDDKKVSLKNFTGKKESVKMCDRFSISETPTGYIMSYVKQGRTKSKNVLVIARSRDLYEWKALSELPLEEDHHTTVVYSKAKDAFELYRDGLFIRSQSSNTLAFWKEKPQLLFTSRNDYFDREKISIIGSMVTKDGILLLYDASVEKNSQTLLQAGAVIFDINNPKRIIWRSVMPIWQGVFEGKNKSFPIKPLGFATLGDTIIIYWLTNDLNLIASRVPGKFKEIEDNRYHPKIMNRFHGNPIIEPREKHDWEGEGTFNPTVVEDDQGIVHLLYRSIGKDGISRIGYAQSEDGKHFTKRSKMPVFEATPGYGMPSELGASGPVGYHPAIYTSGGGWGGSEDPRAVLIGEKVYMLYVAFEGWDSVRIALTSISIDDFKAGKWKWKKPKLISPPGKVNKNWLLFPEKINGKFAILHSIAPKILIEYIDDIDKFNGYIDSPRPGGPQPGRLNKWDGLLRGAGPPPVKTDIGWLLLYHALDKTDSSRYKLGAMILDKKDPTKILYRSMHPILSPDMYYENHGKPGVVYASGAVVRGDDLYVYYGGADKVVCVATTPVHEFLKYLITGSTKAYELKKV